MTPKLEINELNIQFDKKPILKDVSIHFADQSVTALIGPSGSGKSVLLRSMNRMHDLAYNVTMTGDILLDGQSIYKTKEPAVNIRRRIGMVFQRPNPFPKTIFENVAFGLRINGITNKNELKDRIEHSLRWSYLWEEVKDELNKSALKLSGGQQQRLCIARAIAIEPEVVLLDEPCSALDPISTTKVEELISNLKNSFCCVIVTHNMQQARRIADNTALMYMGQLIEYGTTDQIFNAPKKELTHNYLIGRFG